MKSRLLLVLLGTAVLPLLIRPARAAGPEPRPPLPLPVWQERILDPGVTIWDLDTPALALDASGQPHLVYGRNFLYHTWLDGAQWRTEMLDAQPAAYRTAVIAAAPDGALIVAAIRPPDHVMLYRQAAGGGWAEERVPLPLHGRPQAIDLAVDRDGRPHLAVLPDMYHNRALAYGVRVPMGWSVQEVPLPQPARVTLPVRLALDGNDQPALLYARPEALGERSLWLARPGHEGWAHEQVAQDLYAITAELAVDAGERAHVLYTAGEQAALAYARETGDGWARQSWDVGGADYPALALDAAGRPHFAYATAVGQYYATPQGAALGEALVQSGDAAGSFNTLILDSDGAAHLLSLESWLRHTARYATNRGGAWQAQTVAQDLTLGFFNALALDEAGAAHALYDAREIQKLLYGRETAAGWQVETVAAANVYEPQIAWGADGPVIAYMDVTADALRYGTRDASGSWLLETVDEAGGQLTLALDAAGQAHLLFVRGDDLVYWRREGESWQAETVAAGQKYLSGVQMALDAAGRPWVTYSAGGATYLLHREATRWTSEPLPYEEVAALALDPGGAPLLLATYTTYTYQGRYPFPITELLFVERAGSGWADTWLGEQEYWDVAPTLRVDAQGVVHVLISNIYGDDYLRRAADGRWLSEDPGPIQSGAADLALGPAGPVVLSHRAAGLALARREIAWLDQFRLLPLLGA